MTGNPAAQAQPEELFKELLAFVEQCQEAIVRGELVDLAGLEASIGALCAGIEALTPPERKRYEAHLKLLFAEVEHLGGALKASRLALGMELGKLDDFRKASIAYRTSDASDEYGAKPKKSD